MVDVPQYYLQHLEDLALAINDTIRYYNDMICLYPMLPTSVKSIKEQTLVLGYGNNLDLATCPERQHFWAYQSAEAHQAVLRLQHMIMRVVLLCERFIEGKSFFGNLKYMWYNPNAAWSLRPIPYYYRNDSELKKYWNAPELSSTRYVLDYDDAPSFGEVTDKEGRLFLQGHLNQNALRLKQDIESFIAQRNLDIKVEIVEVCKKTLADERKGRNDVGKNTKGLFASMLKAFEIFSVQTPVKRNILNIEIFLDEAIPAAQTNKICRAGCLISEELHNIKIDDIKKIIKTVLGNNYKEDDRMYGSPYLRAFDSFKTYFTKSYNAAYRNLKMTNGYPEKSTILLFYYDDRVIYDLCL